MLTERGYYQIILSDNTIIPIRFGTWSLTRFCELRNNTSLKDLYGILGGGGASLKDFVLLILCAAESATIEKKIPFEYTEYDVCNWIDDMGGMGSEKFGEMIQVLANSANREEDKSKKKPKAA